MAEKRIVMEVRVLWVTDDDDETVRRVMQALDAADVLGPVDYVQTAFMAGAPIINFDELELSDGEFEVRLEGPDKWAIAYDGPTGDRSEVHRMAD